MRQRKEKELTFPEHSLTEGRNMRIGWCL
jgi:hypothetical protein